MSPSMRERALLHLLGDVRQVLIAHGYAGDVWNGATCNSCNARGGGRTEPHRENCKGVKVLRDASDLMTELMGKPDAD